MKNVEKIELVLENCDVITFPFNVIGEFCIENIDHKVARMGMNVITDYKVAKTVLFSIFKEGNTIYNEFGCEAYSQHKFDRINNFSDITSIEVYYEDGTKDEFYVDYDEEEEDMLGAPNINQKSVISDLGDLYVLIDAKKVLYDIFDREYINNKDEIETTHDLFDIGVEKPKEHEFKKDDIPKMYRYVYISAEIDGINKDALAVRVYDKNSGWKFIYEKSDNIIPMPEKWIYPDDKIASFIDSNNSDFSIKSIVKRFPIPNKRPEKESNSGYDMNFYWRSAKSELKDALYYIKTCKEKYPQDK